MSIKVVNESESDHKYSYKGYSAGSVSFDLVYPESVDPDDIYNFIKVALENHKVYIADSEFSDQEFDNALELIIDDNTDDDDYIDED